MEEENASLKNGKRRKSPQQQLFDKIFLIAEAVGGYNQNERIEGSEFDFKTYSYLPPDATALPFIYVGEQFFSDLRPQKVKPETMGIIYRSGKINQRLSIYGDWKKRNDVAEILDEISFQVLNMKRNEKTENFDFEVVQVDGQILPDTSTNNILQRGILEFEITFI